LTEPSGVLQRRSSAELHDYKLAMVEAKGEFAWHSHPATGHVLLIEPIGTPNTGDSGGELTAAEERI
jgi:hypothetical protein